MLDKSLFSVLITIMTISLVMMGCVPIEQLAIDDGGQTSEGKQIIDEGGLVATLADTTWELAVIREFDALLLAVTDSPAVIEFKANGAFTAMTGCGEVAGNYTLDAGDLESISFEAMVTTSVASCTDDQVAQGLAMENLIQNAIRYSIEDETLTIAIDDNNDAKFELKS